VSSKAFNARVFPEPESPVMNTKWAALDGASPLATGFFLVALLTRLVVFLGAFAALRLCVDLL
jgi:hypothetical protein